MSPTTEPHRPPLLYPGQRLAREEFQQRLEELEQQGQSVRGFERLEGVVYMPAAIRIDQHGEPQLLLVTWLGVYAAATPGVQGSGNASSRIDFDNDPEGDAILRIRPEYGGQSKTDEFGYITGAPELIVEISGSTSAQDLQLKFEIYRRNGVREYLVWDTIAEELYWFVLHDGDYYRIAPDPNGCIHSRVFPGLWLDVVALLKGDLAQVLKTAQAGMASLDHAQFVAELEQRHGKTRPGI